ncbi:MAG: hypothetical protein ACLP8A_09910 [Methylovirgula sp.]
MTNKTTQSFDVRYPVAFGSGLTAALLFLAARQQTAFAALVLASLSPLPVMIATLGFGFLTGLGSAAAAAVTIVALLAAATTAPFSAKLLLIAGLDGLVFACAVSLPAWWLARLAASGQPQVIGPWLARLTGVAKRDAAPAKTLGSPSSHYPFGDILLSIAAIAFLIVTAMVAVWIARHGSFGAALTTTAARVEPMIVEMLGAHDLPKNLDLTTLTRLIIRVMPPVGASIITLAFAANLWLAGRVVELSHRLPYPWPDIPHDLRIPRFAAPIFVVCFGLSFINGLAGVIASIAAASLGSLFVLQGLAVVHDLSRGMRFRTSVLCGLYLALGFLMPWPCIIFAVIGLVEAAFCLRDRKAATASTHI